MPLAPSFEQVDQLWLPLWPYAADELIHGVYRMSRGAALQRRYIEANPASMSNLLVVDVDHGDAAARAMWHRHRWLPNLVVNNPGNGYAHIIYAVREAITRTEYARRKPLAYAAAVVEGLRRSLDGDKGYSGLMTKNPLHQDWEPWVLTDHLYDLDELAGHLGERGFMPPPSWRRTRRANPIGLGRNCYIFETARTWAYRHIAQCADRTPAASAWLLDTITNDVHALNAEFSEPLPVAEATGIARSIHRWITTKSRMWHDGATTYHATFITIQAARGRKGSGRKGGLAGGRNGGIISGQTRRLIDQQILDVEGF